MGPEHGVSGNRSHRKARIRVIHENPTSEIAAKALEDRAMLMRRCAESIQSEWLAGRNVDPHRLQWALQILKVAA
jgi:hypothetical protein